MADHEVRGDRAVYDIETEEPRGTGRRRPAADWGVSEELFDRMPSPRRRFRPAEAPSARRESHPRRFEPARDDEYAARDDEYAARDDEHPAREREHAARDAERPARAARTARHEAVPAFERLDERRAEAPRERRRDIEAVRAAAAREAAAREEALMLEPPAPRAVESRGGVPGRRTVVIGGQASLARRRPAPTVPERIGPRPDRLAAYAVALGLLLIIIALISQ